MGIRQELIDHSTYTSMRTLQRLEGLTDDEFRWEPTPGAWTVRRLRSGRVIVDNNDYQVGPAPMTSLAWRIAHLIDVYGSPRNSAWLRIDAPPTPSIPNEPWTIAWTADESVALLRTAASHFNGLLECLDDDAFMEKLGPIAGQWAESTLAGFALHQIDEAIHHGAEVGFLRDLYRAQREPVATPTNVGEAAEGGRWDLVEEMVLDGRDPNEGGSRTALHFAAALGDIEIVRLLVDHGADTTAKDPLYDGTPEVWADFFGRHQVRDFLRERA